MPFPFTCPHCGLETMVDDEFAGESGPCAGCGKEIKLPSLTIARAAPAGTISSRSNRLTIVMLVVASIVAAGSAFLILVTYVFPSFSIVQDTVHRSFCRNNLSRIAQALQQYELTHGTLPPAYIPDVNGKPMHSWRVLILPQLGEMGLYNNYNFDEPWDGPNNSQLTLSMPDVFACPADPDALAKSETSYMVITGPKTLFPGANSTPINTVSDNPSTTILVAEVPVAGVVWTRPSDLSAERMQFMINSGQNGEIGSYHLRGAHVAMLDGTVYFIRALVPIDYLEGMSTIRGGEYIPQSELD